MSTHHPVGTSLHQAARRFDLAKVRELLEAGADPNARDGSGARPLHYAVSVSHAAMIDALVEGGAEVDVPEEQGHTPLAHAVALGKIEAIQALLARGADPRFPDLSGETPLDRLSAGLGTGAIGEMWTADAQLHGPDQLAPYLCELIDGEEYTRILFVLNPSLLPGHFSSVGGRGALPLDRWTELARELSAYCAERGAWSALHALRVSGLPVTFPAAVEGRSWARSEVQSAPPGDEPVALVYSALVGGGAVPFLLDLAAGACAPALDAAVFALASGRFEGNPEHEAFERSALRALLAAGAGLNARAGEAAARLHVGLRLPRGGNGLPLWDDERGLSKSYLPWSGFVGDLSRRPENTPLLRAADQRSPLLPFLIAEGADREATDDSGRNALHRASTAGHVTRAVETVRLLLDAGLPVDQPDHHGWRPLTLATHPEILRLLVERGATPELNAEERRRLGKKASDELTAKLRAG